MEKKRRGYSTTEAQVEATRRYRNTEAGREKTKRGNYKSNCRSFIKNYATLEELEELEKLILEAKGKF